MSHITAWVEALESGDYGQTEGVLQDDIGYCCLGVAVDVMIQDGEDLEWVGTQVATPHGMMLETRLEAEERKLLGIHSTQQSRLMHMNDEEHKDFKEIAAEIRRMFPEEFA